MKKILIIACVLTLSACKPSAEQSSQHNVQMNTIPELHDCKTFSVSDGSKTLWIVRCPALETTSTHESHSCGKGCTSNTDTSVISEPRENYN